jgi:hypothetical protein
VVEASNDYAVVGSNPIPAPFWVSSKKFFATSWPDMWDQYDI